MKSDPSLIPVRQQVIQMIMKIIRVPENHATRLEEFLFQEADSIAVYSDPATLKQRLKTLVQRLKQEKEERAAKSGAEPISTALKAAEEEGVSNAVQSSVCRGKRRLEGRPFLGKIECLYSSEDKDLSNARGGREERLRDLCRLENEVLSLMTIAESTASTLMAHTSSNDDGDDDDRSSEENAQSLVRLSEAYAGKVDAVQEGLRRHASLLNPMLRLGGGDYIASLETSLLAFLQRKGDIKTEMSS